MKLDNKILEINLPWPVVNSSKVFPCPTSNEPIIIIANKSVDDAWPEEYGGRSKLDVNLLRPWKDTFSDRLLEQHIEAQFQCEHLFMMKQTTKLTTPMPPLDRVRAIIRNIFHSHHHNSFQLMAIHGPENPNNPIFFIRVHPPVRISPKGSPFLLASVIDYNKLDELIEQEKVDREAFQSHYHQIITEGVSKEVWDIRASTIEELIILRYKIRVNSTKMRRSAWQSKNLPRGSNHPWISTFVTPLYKENIKMNCLNLNDFLRK